jgi:hypothetical protein
MPLWSLWVVVGLLVLPPKSSSWFVKCLRMEKYTFMHLWNFLSDFEEEKKDKGPERVTWSISYEITVPWSFVWYFGGITGVMNVQKWKIDCPNSQLPMMQNDIEKLHRLCNTVLWPCAIFSHEVKFIHNQQHFLCLTFVFSILRNLCWYLKIKILTIVNTFLMHAEAILCFCHPFSCWPSFPCWTFTGSILQNGPEWQGTYLETAVLSL